MERKARHNYIGNGHFADGEGVENEYGSNPTNEIIQLENPGHSDWVLAQSGASSSEYEIHFKDGYSIQPNTTYTLSAWVSSSDDYNGTYLIFHSRYYVTEGDNVSFYTSGNLYETIVIEGRVWERRYFSFTTNEFANGLFSWYFGYGNGVTVGYMYATDIQIEIGDFPSPYIIDERSNTEAILDMTGNQTITASELTYNSDNTFEFDGVDDYFITSDRIPTDQAFTVETVFKRNDVDTAWIINQRSDTINSKSEWQIILYQNNCRFSVIDSSNTAYSVVTTEDIWNDTTNVWFVTGISDGAGNLYIYVNGNLSNTGTYSNTIATSSESCTFGQSGWPTAYTWLRFNGELYNSRVYNRVLSADEVKQNYNAIKGRFV